MNWGSFLPASLELSDWQVLLWLALLLRALLVLVRGVSGAAWRSLLALLVGAALIAQLALEGSRSDLLPSYLAAALVVVLFVTERPHPEGHRLLLGRNRNNRRPPPWPRMLLAVLTVLACVALTLVQRLVLAGG